MKLAVFVSTLALIATASTSDTCREGSWSCDGHQYKICLGNGAQATRACPAGQTCKAAKGSVKCVQDSTKSATLLSKQASSQTSNYAFLVVVDLDTRIQFQPVMDSFLVTVVSNRALDGFNLKLYNSSSRTSVDGLSHFTYSSFSVASENAGQKVSIIKTRKQNFPSVLLSPNSAQFVVRGTSGFDGGLGFGSQIGQKSPDSGASDVLNVPDEHTTLDLAIHFDAASKGYHASVSTSFQGGNLWYIAQVQLPTSGQRAIQSNMPILAPGPLAQFNVSRASTSEKYPDLEMQVTCPQGEPLQFPKLFWIVSNSFLDISGQPIPIPILSDDISVEFN